MNKIVFASSGLLLLALWISSPLLDERFAPVTAVSPEAAAADAITGAVKGVLAKLSKSQVEKASFAYDDKERIDWHFIPRPRKGLPLSEMDKAQCGIKTRRVALCTKASGSMTRASPF